MLKETIEYEDFNGNIRKEEFLFNLSQSEIVEMVATSSEPLDEKFRKVVEANNGEEIMRIFKEILFKSYGEKSEDGRRFVKSPELSKAFSETEAYNKLYMRLVTEPEYAATFIKGVLPKETTNTKNN